MSIKMHNSYDTKMSDGFAKFIVTSGCQLKVTKKEKKELFLPIYWMETPRWPTQGMVVREGFDKIFFIRCGIDKTAWE